MAWHTTPTHPSILSTFSQEQVEEFSLTSYLDTIRSERARLNPTQEISSSFDNRTGSSQSSLSGTTSAPSMDDPFGEPSISSREDFLAKTFQPREQITAKNLELPESVQAYGASIKGLLEKLNLVLSSRKTHRCCALGGLSPSSKTLPAWGIMLDGVSWEVGTSARTTREIESGYLPTVLATDWKGGTTAIRKDKGRQRFDQWRDYVKIKYGLTYPHPTHSELRMGWPEKWTDSQPLEMDKFQSWLRRHGISSPEGWSKVVYASDCEQCPYCDDLICATCGEHYAECDCIGPTEDDVEYKDIDGETWGRRLPSEDS